MSNTDGTTYEAMPDGSARTLHLQGAHANGSLGLPSSPALMPAEFDNGQGMTFHYSPADNSPSKGSS